MRRWRCITPRICSEKQVYGWFIASSISAFIVGVTEPIEFAFMFVAPVLFVIHALLTGLSLFIAHYSIGTGFSFSAGLIDYALSLINPVANHPLMILVQGIVFFALYYFIFRFVIKIFNLNTIGRGDNLLAIQLLIRLGKMGQKLQVKANIITDKSNLRRIRW